MNNKTISILAIGAIVISIIALVIGSVSFVKKVPISDTIGTIGTMLAEDYIPVIKYNDGYYSELDITTTGTLTAATGTFSSTLGITGATTASTFTQGGGVTSTSTSGSVVPLLASAFDTENVIDVMLNVQDATLSFPASSTLTSFIPTSGQTRTLFIRNATTTASIDLTISGGTGVLLKNASSSPSAPTISGDTDGANYGVITLIRKANTDIEALLEIFKD